MTVYFEVGKIGLIYSSDYGYAGGATCSALTTTTCAATNWLIPTSGTYWTISPNASSSESAWVVYSSGNAGSPTVSDTNSIRPSVYLKPSVKITGGDGTEDNPYRLSA